MTNRCIECGIDMGDCNPRQLCGKTRCLYGRNDPLTPPTQPIQSLQLSQPRVEHPIISLEQLMGSPMITKLESHPHLSGDTKDRLRQFLDQIRDDVVVLSGSESLGWSGESSIQMIVKIEDKIVMHLQKRH